MHRMIVALLALTFSGCTFICPLLDAEIVEWGIVCSVEEDEAP